MKDFSQFLGKRLVSSSDAKMYRRFPNSDQITTLAAGQPSPLITGYLKSGFYQLEGPETEPLYIADSDRLKIVPPDTEDNSGLFSGAVTSVYDFFSNTSNRVSKKAGFLQEGFEKSVGGVKGDFFNLTDAIKPILLLVGGILVLMIINNITD